MHLANNKINLGSESLTRFAPVDLFPGVSISFNAVATYGGAPLALSGADLTPRCTATGFAARSSLRFQWWQFNGSSTSNATVAADVAGTAMVSFFIVAPARKDAGWYNCTATSGNTSAQASAYLNVACKH